MREKCNPHKATFKDMSLSRRRNIPTPTHIPTHTHSQTYYRQISAKPDTDWWKAVAREKFQWCLAGTTGFILHAVKYSSETEWMENPTFKSYINISFSHRVFQLKCSYNEGRGDSLDRAFKHPDGCQTVIKRRGNVKTVPANPSFSICLAIVPDARGHRSCILSETSAHSHKPWAEC